MLIAAATVALAAAFVLWWAPRRVTAPEEGAEAEASAVAHLAAAGSS